MSATNIFEIPQVGKWRENVLRLTLETLLEDLTSEKTAESIRQGPHVALIQEALRYVREPGKRYAGKDPFDLRTRVARLVKRDGDSAAGPVILADDIIKAIAVRILEDPEALQWILEKAQDTT